MRFYTKERKAGPRWPVQSWAGEPGFRDFPGLSAAKENRNGSRRTLPKPPPPSSITAVTEKRMPTPSNTLKEVEETLRLVIENLIDGQDGFQKIGDEIKDETLKSYFLAESLKRAQFRGDLESILHQEGVHDIKEKGTAAAVVYRAWGSLKTAFGGGDHALLETAEQAEDEAKEAYEDALTRELPLPVRQLLVSQLAHIEASHDYLKAARDSRK
jgi:uncharacterized protein (TIGR02284 family)